MRKKFILLIAVIILALALPRLCSAEKIYCKDGKIIKGEITSRTKGIIWIKVATGLSEGISTKKIERIENDDGSISKYDYETLQKKIKQCISKSQYEQAEGLCNTFLEAVPKYTRMRYLCGILEHRMNKLKEAAENYDFLIANKAADSRIYNNRGIISAGNKEYDDAVTFFIMAIRKDPNMAAAHNNLANVYMQQKKYDKAIGEYKKVLDLEPKNTKVLYNLGMAYNDMGDHTNAESQWKKILSINPEDIEAKKALDLK